MKVLIVDESGALDALAGELHADGLETLSPPVEVVSEAAGGEVAEIADALIALERLLAGEGADALLLGSASNVALAAVLVATKAGIPVAAVGGPSEPGPELNARLIARLADAVLAADAPVVAGWLRGPGAG